MKWLLGGIILIVFAFPVFSQFRDASFREIDREVKYINAMTPDSLAFKLASPYKTELEKLRAIFSWITQNIAYNTGIRQPSSNSNNFGEAILPDSVGWKSANEMTAYLVLRRRKAVCEGYAKLFATLCHYAGIKTEVITGYAMCCPGHTRFRTNHSWNAVRIDSTWHLIDVTWASGYINHRDEFVQYTDETYFLAKPERFIKDHFPDDLRWTLLNDIPSLPEFRRSPYLLKSFVKYNIGVLSHPKGLIEASSGDTLVFQLEIRERERDEKISQDAFFDSTVLISSPRSIFIDPVLKLNKAVYSFIVPSSGIEWLHLKYNGDIILRYRLKIKNPNSHW